MIKLQEVSILNIMPQNIARDKNVQMAAQAFDEVLREAILKIPDIALISRLVLREITDHLLADMLALQFHVDFYDQSWPIERKLEVIVNSPDWHTRKGTPSAVEEVVSTAFDEAEVLEWYEYDGLPYRFSVETEDNFQDMQHVNDLVAAIFSMKNTRSWIDFITTLTVINTKHYIGTGFWGDYTLNVGAGIPFKESGPPAEIHAGAFPSLNVRAAADTDYIPARADANAYHVLYPSMVIRAAALAAEV